MATTYKVTIKSLIGENRDGSRKWRTDWTSELVNEFQMMDAFKFELDHYLKKNAHESYMEPVSITASSDDGRIWATFSIR